MCTLNSISQIKTIYLKKNSDIDKRISKKSLKKLNKNKKSQKCKYTN